MSIAIDTRRYPIGAEVLPAGGVSFRVWAPDRQRLAVVIRDRQDREHVHEMQAAGEGYFTLKVSGAGRGTRYGFRSVEQSRILIDPASRFQPEGPDGFSEVVDPGSYRWGDDDWPGVKLPGQVIYELHIGTFAPAGTWDAAAERLEELADVGLTLLELMPVNDFAGTFGWSYDGVSLFAPTRLYGRPDDFRRFVGRAHSLGIGVLLDVVYNHFGNCENCFQHFTQKYFTDRYKNEWGKAINFDGPGSQGVREFFLTNVRYWIDEFHVDGYRIDATQQFFDQSEVSILGEIAETARKTAKKPILIIAENEPQQVRMLRPITQGGHGMDAAWNDDFHHSAMVRLTGSTDGYYHDYRGHAGEFVAMAKRGYLYQGQRYPWQNKRRGSPTAGISAMRFVNYLQNHDQIANSARGERAHQLTGPGLYRAMTALMLLMPQTPLLFQGQEFCASTPFLYFNDSAGELGRKVIEGRKKFLSQFKSLATPEAQATLTDPTDRATFERSKLIPDERLKHNVWHQFHKDLLRLRREDPVFSRQDATQLDGAALTADGLLLRHFDEREGDRLVLVNFGCDLRLDPAPDPLFAPPENRHWELLWSSESPAYGGNGTPAIESEQGWFLPGEATVVLAAVGGAPTF
jgi:maltooligosyltrehalose trehalohydrolase